MDPARTVTEEAMRSSESPVFALQAETGLAWFTPV